MNYITFYLIHNNSYILYNYYKYCQFNIHIVIGINERGPSFGEIYNTNLIIDNNGSLIGKWFGDLKLNVTNSLTR